LPKPAYDAQYAQPYPSAPTQGPYAQQQGYQGYPQQPMHAASWPQAQQPVYAQPQQGQSAIACCDTRRLCGRQVRVTQCCTSITQPCALSRLSRTVPSSHSHGTLAPVPDAQGTVRRNPRDGNKVQRVDSSTLRSANSTRRQLAGSRMRMAPALWWRAPPSSTLRIPTIGSVCWLKRSSADDSSRWSPRHAVQGWLHCAACAASSSELWDNRHLICHFSSPSRHKLSKARVRYTPKHTRTDKARHAHEHTHARVHTHTSSIRHKRSDLTIVRVTMGDAALLSCGLADCAGGGCRVCCVPLHIRSFETEWGYPSVIRQT